MTDFQVGDRVSVEGVIGRIDREHGYTTCLVRAGSKSVFYDPSDITLIERPNRKLRVGSVWERWGTRWVVGADEGKQHLVHLAEGGIADVCLIEASPDVWREVPVEELENEAADGS